MNKRGFYFQRKFWMFFNFYLKPFLSVRGFSFFNIMKTQLSKDERYILGKKKILMRVDCHWRADLIANIGPRISGQSLTKFFPFSTHHYFFCLCPLACTRNTILHLSLPHRHPAPGVLWVAEIWQHCTEMAVTYDFLNFQNIIVLLLPNINIVTVK